MNGFQSCSRGSVRRFRRLFYFALSSVLPYVSFPLSTAAEEENLLRNGSFELVDGEGPAFWQARTLSDSVRRLTRDGTVSHSGQASVLIHNLKMTRSRWRTGYLRDQCLVVGTEVFLRAWIRTDLRSGQAYLTLYCLGKDGSIVSQPRSAGIAGQSGWQQIELNVTVPDGALYVMPYLELEGIGKAWFDSVSLQGTRSAMMHAASDASYQFPLAGSWRLTGFRPGNRLGKSVIELPPGQPSGEATMVFWEETATYDITIHYVDERDGVSELAFYVNEIEKGRFQFDQTPADSGEESVMRTYTIHDVPIQRRSVLRLKGKPGEGEYCRVYRVDAVLSGPFTGDLLSMEQLYHESTLNVIENPRERRQLMSATSYTANIGARALEKDRERGLAELETPEQWLSYQAEFRAALPDVFGTYGPPCDLNVRSVGQIARDGYVIEKLLFDTHPGYPVTANLYLPAERTKKAPGILFTCGHAADGKAYHLYHECALGFVLKGYVVLSLDPVGQGERREYFDAQTGVDYVRPCVPQHHYLSRPSFLVGRCLAGYRTWDCKRAVDVLVSRPEVDPDRLGVVGNSGGGQMALLAAAFDERLKACAAAHPGGSQENTYLTGQGLVDRDILGLIAPRPCVFIVGKDSGEERGHRSKYDDMARFYRGLGASAERLKFELVDGVHDMKKAKRVVAYAWMNRWLAMPDAGADEPELQPETVEALHCTDKGNVMRSLGTPPTRDLNRQVAVKQRTARRKDYSITFDAAGELMRKRLSKRIGLNIAEERPSLDVIRMRTCTAEGVHAEKMLFTSEPGVQLPAVLMHGETHAVSASVILHVSQQGKPENYGEDCVALQLVSRGLTVLSVDVRGSGETDVRRVEKTAPLEQYCPVQWRVDGIAVRHVYADTTLLARQVYDVVRALDLANELALGSDIWLVGEELGGVWALLAAVVDFRPKGVICTRMLLSYEDLAGADRYTVRDYFWVPGILNDVDICELPLAVLNAPVVIVDPVSPREVILDHDEAVAKLTWVRTRLGHNATSVALKYTAAQKTTLTDIFLELQK